MSSNKWIIAWLLSIFLLMTGLSAAPQDRLAAAEFARLIRDLSEEGGFFPSDNFTSNEDSYLTILDSLKQLGVTGGAYLGVGPEQNFTYIAKIRPRIAFIVDIRRQAMIQQLMYKAIFHLAPTRAEFLSLLLSRPLKEKAPGPNDSIEDLAAYFSRVPADEQAYAKNLSAIRDAIRRDFLFPLSKDDGEGLEYIYRNFRLQGLGIGFDINGDDSQRFGRLPTLKDLLVQKDLHGKPGSFLAGVEDYDFVRGMQKRNMIVPVVGDFGGKKALAAVGQYLKKNNYRVTAFYLSNVEIVLFDFERRSLFPEFVGNVKSLPIDSRSLFIRSTFSYYKHPAQQPGYALCTWIQNISSFLKEYDAGCCRQYNDLIKSSTLTTPP
jgi:hypothetical protein